MSSSKVGVERTPKDADAFRVRNPSYQRWTRPTGVTEKTWDDMLNGIMGLNKIDPESVTGFRIQVNFKREREANH